MTSRGPLAPPSPEETPEPAHGTRRVAVLRLLSEIDVLRHQIVTQIAREVPAYATLDVAQMQEVDQIALWGIRRALEAWVEGSGLTVDDQRMLHGIGAARALDGRPLMNVLKAYRIAGRVVTDAVVEAAGAELSAADAVHLARVWMQSMDEITDALGRGHEQTNSHLQNHGDQALHTLVRDLLLGRNTAPSALRARAAHAGIAWPSHVGIVVGPDQEPFLRGVAEISPSATHAGTPLPLPGGHRSPDLLPLRHSMPHDGSIALLDPALLTPEPLARAITTYSHADTEHGSGQPIRWAHAVVPTASVPTTYALLRHALHSAPAHVWRGRRVLGLADAHVVALATGSPSGSVRELARTTVAAVADDPLLLTTLHAHLATDNANETARLLSCHPQSVRDRLRRIARATGRDPRDPWDRHVLQTALMALTAGSD